MLQFFLVIFLCGLFAQVPLFTIRLRLQNYNKKHFELGQNSHSDLVFLHGRGRTIKSETCFMPATKKSFGLP